jgi:hypothetical protein
MCEAAWHADRPRRSLAGGHAAGLSRQVFSPMAEFSGQ